MSKNAVAMLRTAEEAGPRYLRATRLARPSDEASDWGSKYLFRHPAGRARMEWDELIQSQRRSAEHEG